MRKPERRGALIDSNRFIKWESEFNGFRHQVTAEGIDNWLNRFASEDRDIAARLLDSVLFVNSEKISCAYRTILSELPGWHTDEAERIGTWKFVPYSSSPGESGDSMLVKFRHANNLTGRKYSNLFIYRSEILRQRLGANDTVVLVDDMVGSGTQACTSWQQGFGEMLAEVGNVYLVVVTACDGAIQRISEETDMIVRPHIYLNDSDNFFHSLCKHFKTGEKAKILEYCTKVDKRNPKGFSECGLGLVFSHTIPNNSLPILGKTTSGWAPLFRRYD